MKNWRMFSILLALVLIALVTAADIAFAGGGGGGKIDRNGNGLDDRLENAIPVLNQLNSLNCCASSAS
jgi:hypothetical protein